MISKNKKESQKIAKEFLKTLFKNVSKKQNKKATIVGLSGDLGTGKTTFTQYIAKDLGVKNKIHSPTFVIMKRHILKNNIFENFYHIDAYRIKEKKELEHIGWKEIINNPKNLVFIEWPEMIKSSLPKKYFKIKITHTKEQSRDFNITI